MMKQRTHEKEVEVRTGEGTGIQKLGRRHQTRKENRPQKKKGRLFFLAFFTSSRFEAFHTTLIFPMFSSHFTIFFTTTRHRDTPYSKTGLLMMHSIPQPSTREQECSIAGAETPWYKIQPPPKTQRLYVISSIR